MSTTVCTINQPGHDWQNGTTCRWCWNTRTVTEAILSQLSSRRGGDPTSAQQLLDAYRAEVLAEDGQAYDGELAMLRGLVRTLRTVVRPDTADLGEVRRLLHHHATDDATARAENTRPTTAEDGRS